MGVRFRRQSSKRYVTSIGQVNIAMRFKKRPDSVEACTKLKALSRKINRWIGEPKSSSIKVKRQLRLRH